MHKMRRESYRLVEFNMVTFVLGPTCSGKSSIADLIQGTYFIINADSQQIYKSLSILRATPIISSKHRLYGIFLDEEIINAALWSEMAWEIIRDNTDVVIVGGTGLYISALIDGILPVPPVSDDIKSQVRLWSNAELFDFVLHKDIMFKFRDRNRLERAAGVYIMTAITITEWQKLPRIKFGLKDFQIIYTARPSKEKIISRIYQMIELGAIEQVKEIMHESFYPDFHVIPIGLRPIKEWLLNNIPYDTMIEQWANETNQYAKRQKTYFDKFCKTHCDLVINYDP